VATVITLSDLIDITPLSGSTPASISIALRVAVRLAQACRTGSVGGTSSVGGAGRASSLVKRSKKSKKANDKRESGLRNLQQSNWSSVRYGHKARNRYAGARQDRDGGTAHEDYAVHILGHCRRRYRVVATRPIGFNARWVAMPSAMTREVLITTRKAAGRLTGMTYTYCKYPDCKRLRQANLGLNFKLKAAPPSRGPRLGPTLRANTSDATSGLI
jgi:hypothetical protein